MRRTAILATLTLAALGSPLAADPATPQPTPAAATATQVSQEGDSVVVRVPAADLARCQATLAQVVGQDTAAPAGVEARLDRAAASTLPQARCEVL